MPLASNSDKSSICLAFTRGPTGNQVVEIVEIVNILQKVVYAINYVFYLVIYLPKIKIMHPENKRF